MNNNKNLFKCLKIDNNNKREKSVNHELHYFHLIKTENYNFNCVCF